MRIGWTSGEKEFLADLHRKMNHTSLDWRDDAIIVPVSQDICLLYSIDNVSKIKDLYSREDTMNCYGKWAASVICNDIIACGVIPAGLALDIGIEGLSENDFDNFLNGVLSICKLYGTNYEGGNINTFNSVSGIAWGVSKPEKIIKRSGAQDKALIIATANIGVGWAIKLLMKYINEQNASLNDFEELGLFSELISSYQVNPCINPNFFREIWDLNIIQCGMDLTDGVLEFGYEINERTNLGVVFSFQNTIHPFVNSVASILGLPPSAFYFEMGYDTPFAHGWCIDEGNLDKALSVFKKYGEPYTILGYTDSNIKGVNFCANQSLVSMPRFWDDKINNRGSIESWEKIVLPIFMN